MNPSSYFGNPTTQQKPFKYGMLLLVAALAWFALCATGAEAQSFTALPTTTVKQQPSVCSGQMLINIVDVPFCVAEQAGIDFDNLKVTSSVDVAPIKDRWLSSWVSVNYDDGVVACVANSVADKFQRSYDQLPSNMRVALSSIKPANGRVCWKFQ